MQLRDYQLEAVERAQGLPLVYLAWEMRLGKTITALSMCRGDKRVLFVTKKKAISSIESDAKSFDYELVIVNYESLHKVSGDFDTIIIDEAHRLGGYPKPSLATRQLKKLKAKRHILLSGTPTPESWSQIYHQLCVSPYSPFAKYPTFYKWAQNFVRITQKRVPYGLVNDYSMANIQRIKPYLEPFMFSLTQAEAGFLAPEVEEIIHTVEVDGRIELTVNALKRNGVLETKWGTILFDSPTNAMMREHQLWSGTIKTDKQSVVLCDAKARYIKENFKGKFAIYYKYQAERDAIARHFDITDDPREFANSDKIFCSQILAGREGVNLSVCNDLIFYNLDFSYTSYAQTLARMSARDKETISRVHFLFAEGGIERMIYERVKAKEDFTLEHYRKKE